jgi:hypothetical protein
MAFKVVGRKERKKGGEVGKAGLVTMTDGKKLVFNAPAKSMIGDLKDIDMVQILWDPDTITLGFQIGPVVDGESRHDILVGERSLTVKAYEMRGDLPENLRTGKWQAAVTWNEDHGIFVAGFGDAVSVPKRGSGE